MFYVSMHCLDFIVNECESDNGGCEGKCVDTLTLYECHCSDGYSLGSNGFDCEGKYIYIHCTHTPHLDI